MFRQRLDTIISSWKLWDEEFIQKADEGSYVLKLKSEAFDEKIQIRTLVEHSACLLGEVLGISTRSGKERPLGYCFLYWNIDDQDPTVHWHTWYVAVCFSDPTHIGRKDMMPLYTDKQVLLLRIGMGRFDYHFLYRRKTRDHDRAGYSSGAAHLATVDHWKDGL
jgi:hypothetical protein